jgi:GTP-binding protein
MRTTVVLEEVEKLNCIVHCPIYLILLGSALTGRNGENFFVKVPIGTIVSEIDDDDEEFDDLEEAEEDEEEDDDEQGDDNNVEDNDDNNGRKKRKIELNFDKEIVLVAQGGKPGLGNLTLSSGKNKRKSLPNTRTPGQKGQVRNLFLELKTFADVGLVGYPNVSSVRIERNRMRKIGKEKEREIGLVRDI